MSAILLAAKAMKANKNQDSSTQQTITIQSTNFQAIENPFNLEDIFKSDVDRFAELKSVIQFIFEHLEKNVSKINEVDTKMVSKFLQIEKIREKTEANKAEIDKMLNVQNEMSSMCAKAEDDISEIRSDIEACRMNVSVNKKGLKAQKELHDALQEQVDAMKAQLDAFYKHYCENQSEGNAPPPIAAATTPSKDYSEEIQLLNQKTEANTNDIAQMSMDFEARIRNLESQADGWNMSINDLDMMLNRHEKDPTGEFGDSPKALPNEDSQLQCKVKSLNDRLAEAERSIMRIQQEPSPQMPVAMPMPTGDIDTGAVMALIQQLRQDVDKADRVNSDNFKRHNQDILQNKQDILDLKHTDDRQQREINELKNLIDLMNKQITALQNAQKSGPSTNNTINTGQGIDPAILQQILDRLSDLENRMEYLQNEFSRFGKDIQDNLNQKADLDTVKKLEESLLDRLNEIVKALTKQFAEKNDTRKALKLLEKNLKNMYDLFMSKNGGNDKEDDAMFTKKPLGGTSCASCAKDVVDLYGKRVDYQPWGKLPFRDPSERIARVGQGFSKMLSMINPDHLSQYNNQQYHGASQEGLQANGNYGQEQMMMSDPKLMPRGPGRSTQNNFNNQYKQTGVDINRPGSAQVKNNHRPITRGASKNKRGGY